jgi:signal transduction histidine kinase
MSSSPSVAAAPTGGGSFRRLAREYAKVQLVYNPLLVGAAVLGLSEAPYAHRFMLSLTIAAVASSVCFVPVAVALALARLRQRRGRAPAAHGRAWYFSLALLAMPPGLYVASLVTELSFGVRTPATAVDYRFGGFLGMLIAGAFFAWQTRVDASAAALAAERRAESAERLELEAQLAALRAQLDPHLLFNALNTIAALIPVDPVAAERTVLRLAELYRALLAASRIELHSLEQELDICRAYLDVEQVRFAERLVTRVEIAPELDPSQVEVPVLIVQPLVENAIGHGLAGRVRGGTLVVRAQVGGGSLLSIEVEDDGVGLGASSRRGAGLALQTLRQRLRLRYAERAALDLVPAPGAGTLARLRLPLVRRAAPSPAGDSRRGVLTSPSPSS